jgi:hypothetical protein
MRIFLFVIFALSWLVGFVSIVTASTSIQEVLGGVLFVNGTLALVGAALLEQLSLIRPRPVPQFPGPGDAKQS